MVERTTIYSGPSSTLRDGRRHYLVVIDGPDLGRRWELRDGAVQVGRGDTNEIPLSDPGVSTRHCRILRDRGATWLEDLGSTNGTYLDDGRLIAPRALAAGALIKLGASILHYELRDPSEVERLVELDKAAQQVRALLPARAFEGAVHVDWRFSPCIGLGGDAFGYHWIDPARFAVYLLDVCGHGVGACLHSMAALTALRSQTLAVDFGRPSEVVRALNHAFDMEKHSGLYFTLWYGVYHVASRTLRFTSAGHPPALLRRAGQLVTEPIRTRNLAVGMHPEAQVHEELVELAPGDRLYLFSDGVFEFEHANGSRGTVCELQAILETTHPETAGEVRRIEREVRRRSCGPLGDDFSLVALAFEPNTPAPSSNDPGSDVARSKAGRT